MAYLVIGLTGPSGSGKTRLCAHLKERGYWVLNADVLYHKLIAKGEKGHRILVDEFSPAILDEEGEISRKKLGALVFSNKEQLGRLENAVYPLMKEEIQKEVVKHRTSHHVVIDAPTLFESKVHLLCDVTLAILADKTLRVDRIMKRDGIEESQALARIDSQKPDDYYQSRASFAVHNNGDFTAILTEVAQWLGKIEKEGV